MLIKYGYCHCGCGEKTNIAKYSRVKNGWVKGEPVHYKIGHSRRKSPIDYTVNNSTGCWEWQKGKDSGGYGTMPVDGKATCAHRYYYEQKYGLIPEGLTLDHLCRNRACVNPDHLEAVTQAENCRRGNGAKLTVHEVKLIRQVHKITKLSYKKLGILFGCSSGNIMFIINNKTWKGV